MLGSHLVHVTSGPVDLFKATTLYWNVAVRRGILCSILIAAGLFGGCGTDRVVDVALTPTSIPRPTPTPFVFPTYTPVPVPTPTPTPYTTLDASFEVERENVTWSEIWRSDHRRYTKLDYYTYMKDGQYSAAIRRITRELLKYPEDPQLYILRAYAYVVGFQEAELALDDLARVSADYIIHEDARTFLWTAMSAFLILRDAASAVQVGETLNHLPIVDDNTLAVLARAYYEIGEYQLAVDHLNGIIERNPASATAYWSRSLAHKALGNHEKAKKDRERHDRFNQNG